MHHRLSCGRLDQPIESEPVVQAASCIVRSVMSAGGEERPACQHDAWEGGHFQRTREQGTAGLHQHTYDTRARGTRPCPRALTVLMAAAKRHRVRRGARHE